jgi:hypothetical protein
MHVSRYVIGQLVLYIFFFFLKLLICYWNATLLEITSHCQPSRGGLPRSNARRKQPPLGWQLQMFSSCEGNYCTLLYIYWWGRYWVTKVISVVFTRCPKQPKDQTNTWCCQNESDGA